MWNRWQFNFVAEKDLFLMYIVIRNWYKMKDTRVCCFSYGFRHGANLALARECNFCFTPYFLFPPGMYHKGAQRSYEGIS